MAAAKSTGEIIECDGAVAIGHICSRPLQWKTFTGEAIEIETGALFIKAFAGPAAAIIANAKKQKMAVFVESFLEHEGAATILADLGFSHCATKVTAASDLKGLYVWPKIQHEIAAADLATLVCLDDNFLSTKELAEIRKELDAYRPFADHYSSYNIRQSWQAFCLVGYKNNPGYKIKPTEMSKKGKEENAADLSLLVKKTAAFNRFPKTLSIVSRVAKKFQRVRFMSVAAQGGLSRHARS